jgi:uncharacterized integral membrane protein
VRFVFWLIVFLFCAAVVVFAVENRDPVILFFDPLSLEVELPVYAVLLSGFLLGFLFGGIIASASTLKWRRRAKRNARRIALLEGEKGELDAREGATLKPPPSEIPTP